MIQAIITDIEGTTSSLAFVKDVLFPYARSHLADFVHSHANEAAIQALLADTRQIAGQALTTDQVIAQLRQWLDEDQKITPLKTLQGLIWQDGYDKGELQGHIYADAATGLQQWHRQGIKLYVYSSGSVHAQKLLFAHTDHGDLTPLFSGYFDTHIGGKREAESYRKIAADLGLAPETLLFLSDIEAELDAARTVGFNTYWLVRDALPQPAAHRQASDFSQIAIEPA